MTTTAVPPICDCVLNGREPVLVHNYIGFKGEPLGYMARYATPDGGKEYRPWTWNEATQAWESKGFPEPRPLYGLWRMAGGPKNGAVMLVEGEKCADALARIATPYVPVSWPNGAASVGKVDFEPLRGRSVVLWPDRDAPGRKAMARAAEILLGLGCAVKVITQEGTDGWDAADAVADGWDWDRIVAWAKPILKVIEINQETELAIQEPEIQVLSPVKPDEAEPEEPEDLVDASVVAGWRRMNLTRNRNGKGVPHMNIPNIQQLMAAKRFPVWFDSFTQRQRTTIDWNANVDNGPVRSWDINDVVHFRDLVQHFPGFEMCPVHNMDIALDCYAHGHIRNEAQEWLEGLKWDGTPRLDGLLPTYFKAADTDYTRAVGANLIKAIVARVQKPGCKVDTLLVLIGDQGIGKSRGLAALAGPWHGEVTPTAGVADKDFYLSLSGKMLIEIAELHTLRRSRVEDFKAMLSRTVDTYRKPYCRTPGDVPRACVFVGTTNETSFLADPTGARRFWPVFCKGQVDVEGLARDRDQLFAEAKARLASPETWWEVPASEALAAQEAARAEEAWAPLIGQWVAGKPFVTIADVALNALSMAPKDVTRPVQGRIANHLRALGWQETRQTVKGQKTRGWVRPDAGEPSGPLLGGNGPSGPEENPSTQRLFL